MLEFKISRLYKFSIAILVFAIIGLILAGCGSTTGPTASADRTGAAQSPSAMKVTAAGADTQLKTFTLEELKKYDGKNGNPAYVAVDGKVYDVTNVPQWANGEHHGNTAGKDLSEAIKKSPHGKSVLEKLPQVGVLAK